MSTTRPASAPIRIAAIEVSHWHSLYDAAYLRHLARMPDVQLVGLHDPSPAVLAHRAAALGGPPTFADYREMLAETRPEFVIALGRHSGMAETAHYLLDHRPPISRPTRVDKIRQSAHSRAVPAELTDVRQVCSSLARVRRGESPGASLR